MDVATTISVIKKINATLLAFIDDLEHENNILQEKLFDKLDVISAKKNQHIETLLNLEQELNITSGNQGPNEISNFFSNLPDTDVNKVEWQHYQSYLKKCQYLNQKNQILVNDNKNKTETLITMIQQLNHIESNQTYSQNGEKVSDNSNSRLTKRA